MLAELKSWNEEQQEGKRTFPMKNSFSTNCELILKQNTVEAHQNIKKNHSTSEIKIYITSKAQMSY